MVSQSLEQGAVIEPEQIDETVRTGDAKIGERSLDLARTELALDPHLGVEAEPSWHETGVERERTLEVLGELRRQRTRSDDVNDREDVASPARGQLGSQRDVAFERKANPQEQLRNEVALGLRQRPNDLAGGLEVAEKPDSARESLSCVGELGFARERATKRGEAEVGSPDLDEHAAHHIEAPRRTHGYPYDITDAPKRTVDDHVDVEDAPRFANIAIGLIEAQSFAAGTHAELGNAGEQFDEAARRDPRGSGQARYGAAFFVQVPAKETLRDVPLASENVMRTARPEPDTESVSVAL